MTKPARDQAVVQTTSFLHIGKIIILKVIKNVYILLIQKHFLMFSIIM